MMVSVDEYGKSVDLERFSNDGRLTEPADGKKYNWRKMIAHTESLGRPLTRHEMEAFKIRKK